MPRRCCFGTLAALVGHYLCCYLVSFFVPPSDSDHYSGILTVTTAFILWNEMKQQLTIVASWLNADDYLLPYYHYQALRLNTLHHFIVHTSIFSSTMVIPATYHHNKSNETAIPQTYLKCLDIFHDVFVLQHVRYLHLFHFLNVKFNTMPTLTNSLLSSRPRQHAGTCNQIYMRCCEVVYLVYCAVSRL